MELAIQRFNAGEFAAARKLTDDITNFLPENHKMTWIRELYWSAVYLRGCCVQAQGQTQEGMTLQQLAASKFPGLNIENRLHQQGL